MVDSRVPNPSMCVSARAASRPGISGIAACVPTLTTASLPASWRVTAVGQDGLDRLRPDKTAVPHDEFYPATLICGQMEFYLAIDRVLLAAAHLAHAEPRGIPDEMGYSCAPDFVLGRKAGDGGTRTACSTTATFLPERPDARRAAFHPGRCRGLRHRTAQSET